MTKIKKKYLLNNNPTEQNLQPAETAGGVDV